jgi:hypothetical protein
MSAGSQKLCVAMGLPMLALWLVGFAACAGFVPPPSPHQTAAEVAAMYREDTDLIRLGLVLSVIGSALLAPFIAVISVQLKRIEGRSSPLTYAQLALGSTLPVVFILPIMVLETATFRLDRPIAEIQTLNDLGWIMFIGIVTPAALELLLIGIAILRDRRPRPVFPRWVGYYNLWVGVLLLPGVATVFVKSGPLAWNGVLAWWLPLTAFGTWILVMTVVLRQAIGQEEREAASAPLDAAGSGDLGAQVARISEQLAALQRDRTASVG